MMWFGGGPRTDEKVYCLLSKTILSPVVFSELLCLYCHSVSNGKYSCLCGGLSHPRLLLQHDVSNSELLSVFISISKLTCPASHSQGVCLLLASCTNPSLVASAQRNGREGPAGLGLAAGSVCGRRCAVLPTQSTAVLTQFTKWIYSSRSQTPGDRPLFCISLGVALVWSSQGLCLPVCQLH